MTEKEFLSEKINSFAGISSKASRMKIITDTSDWMRINPGDVLRIGGKDYAIRGNVREPRFGIDDQPKYWVFSAIDLDSGKEKIIKTVFNEEFHAHIGILRIRCYRSPEKEGKVLDFVRDDSRFMQGITVYDEKENNVRIIDYIRGKSFFKFVPGIEKSHEQYYNEDLPAILNKLYESLLAICKLHDEGFCHGDIRSDHIIIESESEEYKWICTILNL